MKVRQPLAEAAFSVGSAEEREVISKYMEMLEDELNVKHVRALDAASEAVSYSLNPLPKQLGQKYGRRFPGIRKALMEMDADAGAKTLLDGKPIALIVESQEYQILPDEVEVRALAKSGFAVASEGALMAALVTELTPELEKEGLAREFVRRVQDLRKQAEFEISDRIRIYYEASPGLSEALGEFREYVMNETLAVELLAQELPHGLPTASDAFDGEEVKVSLVKA